MSIGKRNLLPPKYDSPLRQCHMFKQILHLTMRVTNFFFFFLNIKYLHSNIKPTVGTVTIFARRSEII